MPKSITRLGVSAIPLVVSLFASNAQAQAAVALAPPAGQQQALAVGFTGNELRAEACPTKNCAPTQGQVLKLPKGAEIERATLAVVRLRTDRHAIHVRVPLKPAGVAWEAVLAGPLKGGPVQVVFEGKTGFASGPYGLRRGGMVIISPPNAQKFRSIVIGEQREDFTLCGRPTVLDPRALVPESLALKPALIHRLSSAERRAAPRLAATLVDSEAVPAGKPLTPTWATSAIGNPRALTDGDVETTWSEKRKGAGRGEFVVMQTSADEPITGFEVVSRPPTTEVENGVSPKKMWIATDNHLYLVELPDDAWEQKGARYAVTLPEPIVTDCVALVSESSPHNAREDRVTVAEFAAHSALGGASIEELVVALAGGEARAEQAGAALRSRGEPGFRAVAKAFDKLDEGGRRVALGVIDQAPCSIRTPVYVQALASSVEAHQNHAATRLRECGDDAADALAKGLADANDEALGRLAEQLTLVAPTKVVELLTPLLAKGSAKERQTLRVAIGRAARSTQSHAAINEALRDTHLDEVAAVDLLRALGPQLPQFAPAATGTYARLTSNPSFRTKYLLLAPAAHLAPKSPAVKSFLQDALVADKDWRVRERAAQVVLDSQPLQVALLGALKDDSVRVRVATIQTLARLDVPATSHLAELLRKDRWPIARAEAATALGVMGQSELADRALLRAVADESRHVRAPALVALGKRGVVEAAKPARKRLVDDDESINVRIAAATALGTLCDRASLDELTKIARRMADPQDMSEERKVAATAVTALGRIHPDDLRSRLAPLLKKGAPAVAQSAAKAALATESRCGR